MIVRVQSSGQYRLDQAEVEALHKLDQQLVTAVHAQDQHAVHDLLCQMIDLVQTRGSEVGHDELVASDTILPPNTLTLEEVQALLHDESLMSSPATSTL